MEQHKQEIENANLNVVAIGLGQPKHARRFCGKLAPSLTCLTVEEPDLYKTYGIGRGSLTSIVLNPSALKAGVRAAASGFRQGKATGDQSRLSASFLIDTDGKIIANYYGKNAGDHVPLIEFISHSPKA